MSDLLVIVPSRSRPDNISRLRRAWRDTGASADLLVCVDDDDPRLSRYIGTLGVHGWTCGPRLGMVGTINLHAAANADRYRHIGFMGDDHLPQGHGWDKLLVEALDELGTGFVYGNDLNQGAALPTAVFMSADIVRALGYMAPPVLQHLYVDDTWLAWGRAIDRIRYLPGVIIEHLHPTAGKAASDDGYTRVNAACQYQRDGTASRRYMAAGFTADIAKLQALL